MEISDSLRQYFENSNLDRVYGNCHSTLIGFLVNWWLKDSNQYVLEASPPIRQEKKYRSDALLYKGHKLRGLIEVEGTDYVKIFNKIEAYFNNHNEYDALQFVIAAFYPTTTQKWDKVISRLVKHRDAIIQSLQRIKYLIGSKNLYVVIFEREIDQRFGALNSNYYNGRLKIKSVKIIEIKLDRFEKGIEDIFSM